MIGGNNMETPEEYTGHLGIPKQKTIPPIPKKVDDNSKIEKELHAIVIELKTLNSILKRLR